MKKGSLNEIIIYSYLNFLERGTISPISHILILSKVLTAFS